MKALPIIFALTCCIATFQLAAASSPDNPLMLTIDGASKNVNLIPSQPAAWFSISGDLHQSSHLIFETTGDADPEMAIYRSVQDAHADSPMEEDQDSGARYNAKIEQFAGYPLPWLVRIQLENPSKSSEVILSVTSEFNSPEACSGDAGPCSFSMASRGKPGGREILTTMRGVRTFLLTQSQPGSELIDLYYDISRDLLPHIVFNSQLRDRLFQLGSLLAPGIREALKIGLGDQSNYVISNAVTANAREITDLVTPLIAPNIASSLEIWTRRLEGQIGVQIAEALSTLGITGQKSATYTLLEGSPFPVKRDRLIVKLRKSPLNLSASGGAVQTGLSDVDTIFSTYHIERAQPLFATAKDSAASELDRILILDVKSSQANSLRQSIAASPEVEYTRPVSVAYLSSDDVYYPYQYGPKALQAPSTWDTQPKSQPLTAVIDTGIDHRQADLMGKVRLDLGWNYADGNADVMDDHGHGTHVSGTIVSEINNIYSVAGIAPSTQVIPFKVFNANGDSSSEWIAQAIVGAADAGARVINMSFGGQQEPYVDEALKYAYNQGVTLVAAAGNDGTNSSSFPASSIYTLSVGAVDENNELASWSNWGDTDLVAPGVDIVSLGLQGDSCYMSGTSMAAPHVAGAAAQVLSLSPNLSPQQLMDRLLHGAVDLGAPGSFGRGLVNIPNALLSTTNVDLDGTIKTADGSNICAMVLASGQYTFSCNPPGVFSLHDLTREPNGTVKRQIYADGFFPNIDVLSDSISEAVVMKYSGTCPDYNQPYEPGAYPGSVDKRVSISGKVLQENSQTPICAMVLANGKNTFSCDGRGNYNLIIPLDPRGQFKLQVFAEGFAPMVQTFDEFQTTNDVRMARTQECQAPPSLSTAVDSFVQSSTGKCIDMDGAYGCQCVDLMHYYIQEVLGIPRSDHSIRGSAYDIYNDLDNSTVISSGSQTVRLDKISNTPSGVLQKGDIIFWNSNVGGGYGHVAIFISGDINSFTSLDQNWLNSDLNNGSPAAVVNHNSYANVAGWLRPVITSGSPN